MHLRRADQVRGLDHAGPGFHERLALADRSAWGGGANHEAAIDLADADQPRDLLGIDDQIRLHPAGPKLNQQIRAAGQDLRDAAGTGEEPDRVLHRRRRLIIEGGHSRSRFFSDRVQFAPTNPAVSSSTRAGGVGAYLRCRPRRAPPLERKHAADALGDRALVDGDGGRHVGEPAPCENERVALARR